MKLGKLDKIFEDQKKTLIKVKLNSDPAKKENTYTGYLVTEEPTTQPKTGVLGTIANATRSLGRGFQKAQEFTRGVKAFGHGDLSQLKGLGEYFLNKILDKSTDKIELFGKTGYDIVYLNDPELLIKLESYAKSKTQPKESFEIQFDKAMSEVLEEKKRNKRSQKNRRKRRRLAKRADTRLNPINTSLIPIKRPSKTERLMKNVTPNPYALPKGGPDLEVMPPDNKAALPQPEQEPYNLEQEVQSQPTEPIQRELSLKGGVPTFGGTPPPPKEPGVTEPPADETYELFKPDMMRFKIGKSKRYATSDVFVLTPDDPTLKELFSKYNIQMVTCARPYSQNSITDTIQNNLTVYFYMDNENIIPELTTTGLKYVYDKAKHGYVVNSGIEIKDGMDLSKIQSLLLVDPINYNVLSINGQKHLITFRLKAGAKLANLDGHQKASILNTITKKTSGKPARTNAICTGYYVTNSAGQSIVASTLGHGTYAVDLAKLKIEFPQETQAAPAAQPTT